MLVNVLSEKCFPLTLDVNWIQIGRQQELQSQKYYYSYKRFPLSSVSRCVIAGPRSRTAVCWIWILTTSYSLWTGDQRLWTQDTIFDDQSARWKRGFFGTMYLVLKFPFLILNFEAALSKTISLSEEQLDRNTILRAKSRAPPGIEWKRNVQDTNTEKI